jgi:hypothetical protein
MRLDANWVPVIVLEKDTDDDDLSYSCPENPVFSTRGKVGKNLCLKKSLPVLSHRIIGEPKFTNSQTLGELLKSKKNAYNQNKANLELKFVVRLKAVNQSTMIHTIVR